MLAINFKKFVQLSIIFISVSSFIGLNPKSSMAAPSNCKFQEGESYSNQHSGHQGILEISSRSSTNINGKLVNIFSGSWRLASATEGQPVTVQTAGSMFVMIRDLGEFKQVWAGTCESNGFAKGVVHDPSFPGARASFIMKSK